MSALSPKRGKCENQNQTLHPGSGQDRFGQLRVKAAFGPAYSGAARS